LQKPTDDRIMVGLTVLWAPDKLPGLLFDTEKSKNRAGFCSFDLYDVIHSGQ